MGLISSFIRPDYKWQPDFVNFIRDNVTGVLAAGGVYSDLRNIIFGYWLPTTDLALIQQNLDGWTKETSGWTKQSGRSIFHRAVNHLEYHTKSNIWSEAFTFFLIRLDLPFITSTHVLPLVSCSTLSKNSLEDKEYTPVDVFSDTLERYQDFSRHFIHEWWENDSPTNEQKLRFLVAKTTLLRLDNTDFLLMKTLTHVGVSPLPEVPRITAGWELPLFEPYRWIYAFRLATPTITAASWNAWFDLFLDIADRPSHYGVAIGYGNWVSSALKIAFFMLSIDLKCPLNELTPTKSFERCRESIEWQSRYLKGQEDKLGFESFKHFESSVKALQARIDVANETLSIGSRKRKREIE